MKNPVEIIFFEVEIWRKIGSKRNTAGNYHKKSGDRKKKNLENLANFLNKFSMKNSVGRSKFGENSPVKKENTGTAQIFYIIVFWVF
jgi:hypothetical protein